LSFNPLSIKQIKEGLFETLLEIKKLKKLKKKFPFMFLNKGTLGVS
jgi:hypothetical protein